MMMETDTRPGRRRAWIEIDTKALRHNAQTLSTYPAPSLGRSHRLMAVVKAHAYGHGATLIALQLEQDGYVEALAVSCLGEALMLRQAGIQLPIYLLSPVLPSEQLECVQAGFNIGISTAEEAHALDEIAASLGIKAHITLVLDTGMGRVGAFPHEVVHLAQLLTQLPHLVLDGVASHFPSADEDVDYTQQQQQEFYRLVTDILAAGVRFQRLHVANSAGLLGYKPRALADVEQWVRCGLSLYGYSPLPAHQPMLQPVLTWKAPVLLVRTMEAGMSISYGRTFITPHETRTATIAVGYADGYLRALSGKKAEVLIAGVRCPVLGRVTMDQIVVDLSRVRDEVVAGDEAVLIGSQGNETITAHELAQKANTIPYEVLTSIKAAWL